MTRSFTVGVTETDIGLGNKIGSTFSNVMHKTFQIFYYYCDELNFKTVRFI